MDKEIKIVTELEFKSIVEKLENHLKEIKSEQYSKEIDRGIKAIDKELKNSELTDEQKEIIIPLLKDSFDQLENLKDKEHKKNCKILGDKVDGVIEISKTEENFKEGFQKIIEVQNQLKKSYIHKNDKDILWDQIQQSFDRLKKRQDNFYQNFDKISEENYQKIKPILEKALNNAETSDNYKAVWSELKSVQKQFKNLKLAREKHQELWEILQKSFDILKERENIYFKEKEGEWNQNYQDMKKKVEEGLKFSKDGENFKDIWKTLIDIQKLFKIISLRHKQHQELWEILEEGFDILKKRQKIWRDEQEILKKEGFGKLDRLMNRALNEAKTNKNFNDIFEKLKMWQKEVFSARYLAPEQKEQLKLKMDEAFKIFKERQDKYFLEKREGWIDKQKNFIERLKDKKIHLLNTIEKIDGSLKESDIFMDKLKDEYQNSEDDEQKEHINSKIDQVLKQKDDKINSIKDIKDRVEDIEKTVKNVLKEIESSKKKNSVKK